MTPDKSQVPAKSKFTWWPYRVYPTLGNGVNFLPNKRNAHQDIILWSLLQLSLTFCLKHSYSVLSTSIFNAAIISCFFLFLFLFVCLLLFFCVFFKDQHHKAYVMVLSHWFGTIPVHIACARECVERIHQTWHVYACHFVKKLDNMK